MIIEELRPGSKCAEDSPKSAKNTDFFGTRYSYFLPRSRSCCNLQLLPGNSALQASLGIYFVNKNIH
jgi:hypothetical protein